MSDYTPKENTGTLHRNDKGDNPARPDYRGSINVNGDVLRLAAWVKDGTAGKYLSIAVDRQEQRAPVPSKDDIGARLDHDGDHAKREHYEDADVPEDELF